MPAGFVAASITDNPRALAAGQFERGYPSTLGKIAFEADANHAHALVSDEKGPLIEVTMPSLQTIEPSRLAYDHVDAIMTSRGDDGIKTELLVTAPDLKIEHAAICKNARIDYPAERRRARGRFEQPQRGERASGSRHAHLCRGASAGTRRVSYRAARERLANV